MPAASSLRRLARVLHRRPAPAPIASRTRHLHSSSSMSSVSTSASAALYAVVSSPAAVSAAPKDAEALRHHAKDGQGFINPWDSYRDQSGPQIMRQLLWRNLTMRSRHPDVKAHSIDLLKPAFLPSRDASSSLRATWLGHASFFLEFPSGLRILTDPVFTSRCSPFSFIGPKRYTQPPAQIADLPFLDAVLISHNHYDHLSYTDMLAIKEKFPQAHFFVPLGVKKWFKDAVGITNVTELDWWQSKSLVLSSANAAPQVTPPASDLQRTNDISATINCVPSQHTTARTAFDKSQTLWCGYTITSGGKSAYFAGDTGYRSVPDTDSDATDPAHDWSEQYQNLPVCPAFEQIGSLRGPFDLGLIPIGAYAPRSIMSPMHANPYDAAHIFKETRCKKAIGMHWGTWVLTEEDVMEPPRLLEKACERYGVPAGHFGVSHLGESKEF